MSFVKATKRQAKLRMVLSGPSKAGKTMTMLRIATALGYGRVAVGDTEEGSASKYAGDPVKSELLFDFDTQPIKPPFHPSKVGKLIDEAHAAGYGVLCIDSLTHFWNGPGGFLELVDDEVKKMRAKGWKGDSHSAWKEVTPVYNEMIRRIMSAPLHIIVTTRAKQEYAREEDGGKTKVKKLGMAPEFRDSFQFEVDVDCSLDMDHNLVVVGGRCSALDGKVFKKAGQDVAGILRDWLDDGEAAVDPAEALVGALKASADLQVWAAENKAAIGELVTSRRDYVRQEYQAEEKRRGIARTNKENVG